jgi:DNA-binding HxlR family transcriptional regulator
MTGGRPRSAELLLRRLAGRWTPAVLAELLSGCRRYQDLHDRVEGVGHKVLTETLRKAERDGLVASHLDAEHIETATLYELTDPGR